MKYLKISIISLLVVIIFVGFIANASSTTSYSFITVTFPAKKSTYSVTNMQKLEYNHQYLENYSTSQATVDATIKTISVVDSVFNDFVGNTRTISDIDPGETARLSQQPATVTTQVFGQVQGVYDLTMTKSLTLVSKGFGGAWWLDYSYYDATH